MVFKDFIMGEIFPMYYISSGRVCKAHGRLRRHDSTTYYLMLYDAKRVAKADYCGNQAHIRIYDDELLGSKQLHGYFISLDDAYMYLLNRCRKEKMVINTRMLSIQQQYIKDKEKYGVGKDSQ